MCTYSNYQDAMKHFESMRIANANAIADMAIENFVEMRDKTADENFLFRKEVAHKLGNTFPDKFLARYEQGMYRIYVCHQKYCF